MPTSASVVIAAYNAAGQLGACLAALRGQEWTPASFEIVVVDDGSTDRTAEIAEAGGARVVRQPNLGRSAARNAGARASSGEIVLFTDADCVPRPDWVRRMLEPFVDPEIVGCKGTYETHQRELIARFVQLEYEDKYRRMARMPSIDFIDTYSAAYRRRIFDEFGGFDVRIPAGGDDHELSYRVAGAGYRLVFVPRAVVAHRHAVSFRSYVRRKFEIGFWKVAVHRLHPSKLVRDSHAPPTLRLQVPLAYFNLAATLAWLARRSPAWLPIVGWLVFAATGRGLVAAARRDPRLSAAVVPILLGRSLGLGAGMAVGLFDAAITKRWIRVDSEEHP